MPIHKSAQSLLNQLDEVLEKLTDAQYNAQLEVLSNATLGQHIRHTLEFFLCLIDGRNEQSINYDLRRRDEIIETDRKFAKSIIKSIDEFLSGNPEDFALEFCADYGFEEASPVGVKSSFYRELAYNIEHAIHHMALIKIGVRSIDQDIKLPDHFGVASSTVRYRAKNH